MWPSGKAPLFGSGIRRFESYHPSHFTKMNKKVFLSLNDVNFSVGKRKLLKEISLSVHQNDKIALVGKNGVGKSTLINILSGKKLIDSGDLWLSPTLKVGTLNQKNNQSSEFSVLEYLKLINKYDEKIAEPFIERVTDKIKLNNLKIVNYLSGGEKRKLALAELLLLQPDLLLLDEPTNHLDIESIGWLENFLNNEFSGSFLVISHNREFLKNTTNKVFWMDRGIIKISSKGFFNFDNWKDSLIQQEKRELKNRKSHLDDEISWLNKGVKARRKRNLKRKENIVELKNSYEIERTAFLKSISKIRISDKSTEIENGPNILINFINVDKSFLDKGKQIKILNNFNYKLMRGEKIGIIGKNGSGKSTFLNLASQRVEPDSGVIKIKKKINFSFFDQIGAQFDDKKSIKKNLIPSGGDYIDVSNKKIHICGYLKNFLFDPKDIDKPLNGLSGGERNRLLLAKILAAPKEILILDEPTNDLDTETIDILIDFIATHKGSSLISSHDMDFLKKTCDRFLVFDGSGIIKFSNQPTVIFKDEIVEKNIKKMKKIKPVSSEKLINKILKKIERKETEITELTKELEKKTYPNVHKDNYNDLIDKLKKAQIELNFLEKEWIDVEEESINND